MEGGGGKLNNRVMSFFVSEVCKEEETPANVCEPAGPPMTGPPKMHARAHTNTHVHNVFPQNNEMHNGNATGSFKSDLCP